MAQSRSLPEADSCSFVLCRFVDGGENDWEVGAVEIRLGSRRRHVFEEVVQTRIVSET